MKQKDEKEKQYLSEDQDLLDELGKINPSNDYDQENNRKLNSIQIKSILRSRKTMVDLDKSNKRYTKALLIFVMAQILLAGLSLILNIKNTQDQIFAIFITIIFLGSLYWLGKKFDNEINKE